MKWIKKDIDSDKVKEFAKAFDLDLLTAAIFVRRNIVDPEVVKFFLEDDLRYLNNPFLFEEMTDAVQRIQQAASEGERVMVFGDRDVDGITSTVLMTEALQNLGIEVSWGVPMGDDPYGLTTDVVNRCVENDVTLLIAVDCGTSNDSEITYAAEQGIDTIVIDHHNPQEARPPAVAIINPKMPDSGYPFEGLCACGLVSKVRFALGFSHSDFFNQPLCLLNVRPGNDSVILDAVKIENLVEIDRLSESIVPGVIDVHESRLGRFLQGMAILVYDEAGQQKLLRQAFGPGVEVQVIDVATEMWKMFPSLSGKSLLRLQSESRLSRYTGREPAEIDVFLSLFTTFVHRKESAVADDLESCLDLVALGTLADMMPLLDENRVMVRGGLKRMSSAPRPGLRSLLERQRLLGKNIESRDVGWSISPVINASGRMGEPDKAVELLLSSDASELERLADHIVELNQKRRQVGESGWQQVQQQARESYEEHEKRFLIVHHPEIHRGVTGIIAGRLARHYKVPAAVVSVLDNKAVGSVRSARGMVVTDLLANLDDLLDDWGGHDAAGGFHLPIAGVDELKRRLLELIPAVALEDEADESMEVDAELPLSYLTPKLLEIVARFSPFGQENQPLRFLSRGLVISDIAFIGKEQQHIKLTLDAGSGRWPAVYWGAAAKVGVEFANGDTVEAVFHLERNFFQGNETPRMAVIDLRRS